MKLLTQDQENQILSLFDFKMPLNLLDKADIVSQQFYYWKRKYKENKFNLRKINLGAIEKLLKLVDLRNKDLKERGNF